MCGKGTGKIWPHSHGRKAVPLEGGEPLGLDFHFRRGACAVELRAGYQPSPATGFSPFTLSRSHSHRCPPFDRGACAPDTPPRLAIFSSLPSNSNPIPFARHRNQPAEKRANTFSLNLSCTAVTRPASTAFPNPSTRFPSQFLFIFPTTQIAPSKDSGKILVYLSADGSSVSTRDDD